MPVLQGNIYIYDYSTDLIKLSCENPTGWFTDYYLIKNRTVLVYTDYWNQSGWLGLKADDDTIYEFTYGQVILPTSTGENDLSNILINWIYNTATSGGGEDPFPKILMLMGG